MRSLYLTLALMAISSTANATIINYTLSGDIFFADSSFFSVHEGATWNANFQIGSYEPAVYTDPTRAKYFNLTGEVFIAGRKVFDVSAAHFSTTFIHMGHNAISNYDYFDFNGDNSSGPPSSPALLDGFTISVFEIGIGGAEVLDSLFLLDTEGVGEKYGWGSEFTLETAEGPGVRGRVRSIEAELTSSPVSAPSYLVIVALLALVRMRLHNRKLINPLLVSQS